MKKITLLPYLILLPLLCNAKITLPSILMDNMVLQQQTNVKLWGNANPNKIIRIFTSWNKKKYSSSSDNNGKWIISIPTPVAGGPYEIKISDGEELTLKDVLIGEVWLCLGQSNMEMPMKGFEVDAIDGSTDIILKAKASTPIRMYSGDYDKNGLTHQYSKVPLENCEGQWYTNTSENVASTSATAYYFAKYLQEILDIPVGIVVSSWGGSRVEAWMSEESVKPFGIDLSHLLEGKELPKSIQRAPCLLYNARIAPLLNFTFKGLLWNQGEDNSREPDKYQELLPAMVSDYRKKWGIGDFPFYYVELAPFSYDDPNKIDVAKFREMQLRLMKKIPNSGIVITEDLGNPYTIHPGNKMDVGKRLAYWALAKDYGRKNIGYCTPTYKSIEIEGKRAYISFEGADKGLFPVQKSLSSFEIAGQDKIFHQAEAIIDYKTRKLAVWNDSIANPVAVRYTFKNYSEASLFDFYGLPVALFRTDKW